MKIVILAAGIGSRLNGGELPKPLIELANGRSIMGQQLHALSAHVSLDDIFVVVGYKKDMILEAFPHLTFVYNPNFSSENTARSLQRAAAKIDDDLLWINGDVVFGADLLELLLAVGGSAMAVQRREVGEEEVKFKTGVDGRILAVSKTVSEPEGEAVGVNFCRRADLPLLRECLAACSDDDYFERAIELALEQGMVVRAADVTACACLEVDFPADLAAANALVAGWRT